MEIQAKKRFLINFVYLLVIGLTVIIISRFLLFRMFPFILSIIVAALSQKPAAFLSQKTGVKKSFCAVVLSAVIYLGLCAGIIFLIYRLIVSSSGLIDFLPQILTTFSSIINKAEELITEYIPSDIDFSLSGLIQNVLESLAKFLTEIIKKILTAMPSIFVSGIVALVAACYISKDYDGLSRFVKSLCGDKIYNRFLRIKAFVVRCRPLLLRARSI